MKIFYLHILTKSWSHDAVVNVYIDNEKKFDFVEIRFVEEASNAMALDGIIFDGALVKVRRPSDYNLSLVATLGPSQPNPNLNLGAVGLTPGGLEGPDPLNGIKMRDKTLTVRRANQGQTQPKRRVLMLQHAPIGPPPTKVLSLMQVVTEEELVNDEDYKDIMEEMKIECGKFGKEVKELKIAFVRLVSQFAQSQTSAATSRMHYYGCLPHEGRNFKWLSFFSDDSDNDNEEDEEEDDWDTFQSFPASTSEPKSTENVGSDKNVKMRMTMKMKMKAAEEAIVLEIGEGVDLCEYSKKYISGDEDEEEEEVEEVNNENILDQLSEVLTEIGEEKKGEREQDDSQHGNEEKASTHSSPDDDFSGQHSTSQNVDEEKKSTHSNVASEKGEREQDDSQHGNEEKASNSSPDDDFSGQHSTSQNVDEEKKTTHSNVASEKGEREQDDSQHGNEEKASTHSSPDDDFSGQHSTSQNVDEEKKSTHSNGASEKDEHE
nr:hypothetical protein [Tanacetum cinerariifolium]